MKNTHKLFIGIASVIGVFCISIPALASSLPVGVSQFYLAGAGVTAVQNTMQLTSMQTPDGRPITMSMFGTVGYGAIDSQTTAKIEDISFTGITQNLNGTATLTGVTRGLDFVFPYASTGSLEKSHSGGATFIITNTASFYYNEFAMPGNSNVFVYPTASSSVATKGYVDSVAFGNIPSASTIAQGVVQLATGQQAASSTATGSAGPLVIPASLATSTYNAATAPLRVVMTQNSGKIDSNFISTTTLPFLPLPVVGTGADGNVVFDGTNVYTFAATTSASVYQLNRSIFANNLTVNSGITVDTNGYQIFAAGTVNGAGKFRMDGLVGGNAGGSGGGGGASTGNFFKTTAGAAGGSNTPGVSGGVNFLAIGPNGVAGEAGTGGSGAAGLATPSRAWAQLASDVLNGVVATTSTPTGIPTSLLPAMGAGAAGGGGGGIDSAHNGGGGGASGGIVEIVANVLSGTFTIEATGGTGGSPGTGGGRGGGGSGGVCALFYNTNNWSGSCTLTGGTGGNTGLTGIQYLSSLASLLR